jgi:hypothetical protein
MNGGKALMRIAIPPDRSALREQATYTFTINTASLAASRAKNEAEAAALLMPTVAIGIVHIHPASWANAASKVASVSNGAPLSPPGEMSLQTANISRSVGERLQMTIRPVLR